MYKIITAHFFILGCLLMSACSSVQESSNTYTGARPAANEAATLMTLKQIGTAQQTYFARTGSGYGTFAQLVESGALDTRFQGAAPVVNGYVFTMNVVPASATRAPGFTVNADPQPGANNPAIGARHYFMDAAGAIHYNGSQPASASDPLSQ